MGKDPDAIYGEIKEHRQRMSHRVDDLESRARSDVEEVKERVTDRVPDPVLHIGDRVSEHPLTYLAGGFGAGVVLGMLSSGSGLNGSDGGGNYNYYERARQNGSGGGGGSGVASTLMSALSGRIVGAVDDIVRPVVDDIVAGLKGDERRPEERDASHAA